MRENNPRCLKSRLCNMAAYGCLGMKNASSCCCTSTPPGLNSLGVTLTVDGREVNIPCGSQGLTAINVPSYANGTKPWGSPATRQFDAGTVDDGRIEVFAVLGSNHMGGIQAKVLHGIRLAQGSKVEFSVPESPGSKHLYLQNDGEAQPFKAGVRFVVERQFSAKMLYCPKRSGAGCCGCGGESRAEFTAAPCGAISASLFSDFFFFDALLGQFGG